MKPPTLACRAFRLTCLTLGLTSGDAYPLIRGSTQEGRRPGRAGFRIERRLMRWRGESKRSWARLATMAGRGWFKAGHDPRPSVCCSWEISCSIAVLLCDQLLLQNREGASTELPFELGSNQLPFPLSSFFHGKSLLYSSDVIDTHTHIDVSWSEPGA